MRDQKTISSYLLTNILVLLFFLTEKNAIAVDAFVPISSSNNRNINCRLSSSALLADPNFDVSSLLYAEQEKALVTRGKVEEELLAQNGSLLEANIVKGVGGGGGFGGGEASQKARLKSQAKSHAKILKEQGVIRIDHVLRPTELVDGIRESVYQMRETSEQLVASGELPSLEHFANVLLKKKSLRYDYSHWPGMGCQSLGECLDPIPRRYNASNTSWQKGYSTRIELFDERPE